MTDFSKATPRPWNRAGRTVLNFDGELVCGCDFEEDAALIVEAVKSYDAMKTRIAELEAALTMIVDEKCDYMRINNLGDPETQHTIKAARAALEKDRAG